MRMSGQGGQAEKIGSPGGDRQEGMQEEDKDAIQARAASRHKVHGRVVEASDSTRCNLANYWNPRSAICWSTTAPTQTVLIRGAGMEQGVDAKCFLMVGDVDLWRKSKRSTGSTRSLQGGGEEGAKEKILARKWRRRS